MRSGGIFIRRSSRSSRGSSAVDCRNSSFTPSDVSAATASAGGFTLVIGNGQTGFQSVSKTVVASSGTATLEFKIFDVGDTSNDSGVLIDNNSVIQDPPLFLVRDGQTKGKRYASQDKLGEDQPN